MGETGLSFTSLKPEELTWDTAYRLFSLRYRSATVDVHFRTLKTFWRFLRRDGLILMDPMEAVEHPRLERRFAKPFTEEQLRAVLTSLNTRDIPCTSGTMR